MAVTQLMDFRIVALNLRFEQIFMEKFWFEDRILTATSFFGRIM